MRKILITAGVLAASAVLALNLYGQDIKDWITQVNSMHRDRFDQPKNVQLVRAK